MLSPKDNYEKDTWKDLILYFIFHKALLRRGTSLINEKFHLKFLNVRETCNCPSISQVNLQFEARNPILKPDYLNFVLSKLQTDETTRFIASTIVTVPNS